MCGSPIIYHLPTSSTMSYQVCVCICQCSALGMFTYTCILCCSSICYYDNYILHHNAIMADVHTHVSIQYNQIGLILHPLHLIHLKHLLGSCVDYFNYLEICTIFTIMLFQILFLHAILCIVAQCTCSHEPLKTFTLVSHTSELCYTIELLGMWSSFLQSINVVSAQ